MLSGDSLKELRIGIGGIVFSTVSNDPYLKLIPETYSRQFATEASPDIVLSCHYGCPENQNVEEKVFDPGDNWCLFRSKEKFVFHLYSRSKSKPYKKLILESDFKSGDIYIERQARPSSNPPINLPAFQYPIDELLMIILLSLGRGIMLHACGIRRDAKGYLFCGTSGAGKSTIADLWNRGKNAAVLSDDRTVIRRINNRFWVYGTPWHGESKFSSPKRAPLKKIFFIRHAKRNIARKLTPLEAASHLISKSFSTFWSKEGMEFTLKFCTELAQKIPCYELGFIPDKSVLDFIGSEIEQ